VIIFKELKWDNCFSYGVGNSLRLDGDSLTQLVAENGSGKSSIPLILEEVLFNKNFKGIKKADIPNRTGDGTYNISLSFEVDGEDYLVDLKRTKSIKLKLFKNGKDISSHTATSTFKQIQEILKIDYKTFTQLVYQGNNSGLQFLTATDTTRKKFLIELLGLEKYVEYYETFKTVAKAANISVSALESKCETIKGWLEDNKLKDDSEWEIQEINISTEHLEKELAELKVSKDNIEQTNREITSNNSNKKRLDELSNKPKITTETTKIDTSSINSEIGGLKSEQRTIKAQVDKVKSVNQECPTCKQKVSEEFKENYISSKREEFNKLKEKLEKLKTELKGAQEHNKAVEAQQARDKEFEKIYQTIDSSLPEELLVKDDLEEQIQALTSKIKEQRSKLNTIIAKNQEAERHNTKVKLYKEQSASYLTKLKEAEEELKEVKHYRKSVELLKKAFSTNGLLAYKIENLVKELEDLANTYLAELSDGRFTIDFFVEKDKLNINITDEGKDTLITALSSGELARVNIATLLAIRSLMNSISKSRINTLFLDEIINTLDEFGREKLIEVLSKEKNLNSFVVSHGWEHPMLTKVGISKEEGISRIDYGG
jgi:DNA repair exonuclease SbcCD ATPase subunit